MQIVETECALYPVPATSSMYTFTNGNYRHNIFTIYTSGDSIRLDQGESISFISHWLDKQSAWRQGKNIASSY